MHEVSEILVRKPQPKLQDVISGKISVPGKSAMQKSFDAEREVENKLESLEAMVRFQVCYLFDSFLNYFFTTFMLAG